MNLSILQIILASLLLTLFFGDISKIKQFFWGFKRSKKKTRKKGS